MRSFGRKENTTFRMFAGGRFAGGRFAYYPTDILTVLSSERSRNSLIFESIFIRAFISGVNHFV